MHPESWLVHTYMAQNSGIVFYMIRLFLSQCCNSRKGYFFIEHTSPSNIQAKQLQSVGYKLYNQFKMFGVQVMNFFLINVNSRLYWALSSIRVELDFINHSLKIKTVTMPHVTVRYAGFEPTATAKKHWHYTHKVYV